jgi:hypothetical protein
VRIKAMMRNLYMGTDLIPIAQAPDRAQLESWVAAGLKQVRANNFPARARRIAQELKRQRPEVIGIQEAALWRTGPKNSASPARRVVLNYVAILRRAFRAAGLRRLLGRVETERFGASRAGGRWASDHAGVVSTLLLP